MMKKIFVLLLFTIESYATVVKNDTFNQATSTASNKTKKTIAINKTADANNFNLDIENRLPPPSFSWNNQHSIHVIFPNQVEDDLHLQALENIGKMTVSCLFNGVLERESSGKAVVSGCINNTVVSIVMYSINVEGRMFDWINNNVTVEVDNPYFSLNDPDPANDYFYENDEELDRVKRGTFEYYDGEEEYEDMDYDGALDPLPSDLILKVKLAFDTGLLEHMNGDEAAAKDYVIRVATLGRLHLLHASLGTRIHLQFMGDPVYVPGAALSINRKSLTYLWTHKEKEAVPLICFVKTDDTDNLMGVSYPGHRGGACHEEKGSALMKHRSNVNKAAVTFAHEDGHLVGLFHDWEEDERRKKLVPGTTCEGSGIMSRGADRPSQFSLCSAKRLQKWFPNHGQCLVTAPSCDDGLQWSTPCTCGTGDFSVGCSSLHVFCSKVPRGGEPFQCLTRNDIVLASLTARKSSEDLEQRFMILEKKVENLSKKSSYCAYQDYWGSGSSTITYDSITLTDENLNIHGDGLNKDSGVFTAGVAGTYTVQVSMRNSVKEGSYNHVYIRKNNQNIEESGMYSDVQYYWMWEMGGRTMMLHLDKGDTVSLYTDSVYYLGRITFCIKLE